MVSNRIITFSFAVASFVAMAYGKETHYSCNPDKAAVAVSTGLTTDYTPKIHGVLRTRWEGEWGNGVEFGQRFQVRNARLSVAGNILPSVNYFMQIDACDKGKMKILDAWAQWAFASNWKIRAGQFRVPYAVDCFRGPGSYYFANRSFMVKDMLNMREVGARIGYYGVKVPLTVEAGIFNSAAMGDHEVWQCDMNYAAKASLRICNVTLSASYISIEPDSIRINLIDGAATWQCGRWIVEGEYQNKHYAHHSHKAAHGWNLFSSYSIPLQHATFNNLSFQARYDGMTDHSTGKRNEWGALVTDDPMRQRVTIGSTIGLVQKTVKAAIRLNYEKYFYKTGATALRGDSDKIVAELIVKF